MTKKIKKLTKEVNSLTSDKKRKADDSSGDEAELHAIEQELNALDMNDFNIDDLKQSLKASGEIDDEMSVWRSGQNEIFMYDSEESVANNNLEKNWLKPITDSHIRTLHELHALDSDSSDSSLSSIESDDLLTPNSLDECIDEKYFNTKDIFSITKLVRGQSQTPKRRKTTDLRPVVFVRFNARRGIPKPITLVALLDSGATSNLILEKHTKKLKLRKRKGGT